MRSRLRGVVNTRLDPRLGSVLATAYVTVRDRSLCLVRHEGDHWVHRYRNGLVVNRTIGGPSAGAQDDAAEEIFLHGYRPRPGDTVVDIGAGIGGEARVFSRLVGPEGRVVCVEAHPGTFACLRRMVELNGLGNVTAVECAVVGTPGTVHLEDDTQLHLANSLTSAEAGGVAVPGRTLVDVLGSLGVDRVDLLKMNIEGAEAEVLTAFRPHLSMVDNLVVSCHDFLATGAEQSWQRTFDTVTTLLRDAGYQLRTRPDDPRPWVRYYVYASRPGGSGAGTGSGLASASA
ncbi:FkbM family methyltransferase [Micromonospora sp. RP3T]|uniref:FkbM family methyltransferase n=1 Tax=Micromonospora sp. RP3T TaxID=2135446 RepID=UPI001304D801|nr:FkbM family methyltransferase [Micromonospora sp. RP3T]